jgi:hypothetical protein
MTSHDREARFEERHDDYLRDEELRPVEYRPHTVIVGRLGNRVASSIVFDEMLEGVDVDVMELARQQIRQALEDTERDGRT